MRITTIASTLVLGLVLVACGGPDQTASRTVEVGGNRYELVAAFPTDVDRGEVDRLLSRVVLVRHAGPQPIVHSLIEIDVIAHDEESERLYAAVASTGDGETADEAPPPSLQPLTEREPPIAVGEIKGATDPDVDPALPY